MVQRLGFASCRPGGLGLQKMATGTTTSEPAPPRSRRKALVFRGLAIALSLLPLVLFEGLCHLAGWGLPTEAEDPYVAFCGQLRLFELNAEGTRYEIPAARHDWFRPESFAAQKPADEFRIFCLGGSTVQGRPFAIETSFTTWLELNLQAADASRKWEVVNCGGVSYASYRLVPILQEILANYQPDYVIVYTGHNEFLEDRVYRQIEQPDFWSGANQALAHSRTYCVLRGAVNSLREPSQQQRRSQLPAEVDALLDYRGGLADYHRDDAWHEGAVRHYEYNLRRMVQLTSAAGVPLLLVNPASNLKDCPPFKIEPDPGLTDQQRAEFQRLWSEAQQIEADDRERAVELLEQAVAIDPRHAGVRFHLGKCCQLLGRIDDARDQYLAAKDEDICPLRMLEPMHAALFRVAADSGTPLVDVRALLSARCEDGLLGDEILVDHVHPTLYGHELIGDALLEKLAAEGIATPAAGWQQRRDVARAAHLDALDATYFVRGQERLEGLRRWTQGRSHRVRPPAEAK